MLILECSQGCYGRTEGRTDGSATISLRNFVGEGIIKNSYCTKGENLIKLLKINTEIKINRNQKLLLYKRGKSHQASEDKH